MSATQSIESLYEDEYVYKADQNTSTRYKIKKLIKNIKKNVITIKTSVSKNVKKMKTKLTSLNK